MTDENCERIKLSKVLNDLGMKVAACQYFVKILECSLQWNNQEHLAHLKVKLVQKRQTMGKYNKLRPDYEIYTKRLKVVEKAI